MDTDREIATRNFNLSQIPHKHDFPAIKCCPIQNYFQTPLIPRPFIFLPSALGASFVCVSRLRHWTLVRRVAGQDIDLKLMRARRHRRWQLERMCTLKWTSSPPIDTWRTPNRNDDMYGSPGWIGRRMLYRQGFCAGHFPSQRPQCTRPALWREVF